MKLKITPSTGNVFRDLGFRREEAEHLLVRADLMIQIQKLIAARGLKQRAAAQPRVSDLLRGRVDLFSTDALIDMLARLGDCSSDRQDSSCGVN
jgi:predicted XRE-type DNA-binding protein